MLFGENEITGCNYIILVKRWWRYAKRNVQKANIRRPTHTDKKRFKLQGRKVTGVTSGSRTGRVDPEHWAPDKSTSFDFLWFCPSLPLSSSNES